MNSRAKRDWPKGGATGTWRIKKRVFRGAQLTKRHIAAVLLISLILAGCLGNPSVKTTKKEPGVLIVHQNGALEFKNRLLSKDDVIIYPDGFGGEKAAVKIRSLEPLHPAFYRNSIIVQRLDQTTP